MGPKSPVYVAGLERGVRPMGLWSMSMTLSMASVPSRASWAPGSARAPLTLAGQGPVEDVRDERRLARPRDAGDRREGAQREAHVEVLQVVLTSAPHDEGLAVAGAALGRHGHGALAAQEGAGDRARLGQDGLQGPAGDDLAAVLAGRRPDVHDPVGHPDGLLVVLDDEERVADVAEAHERGDELGVVLLVQPDGRLVEDVEDAHEAGADLRRQPDALRLAARRAWRSCGRWSGSRGPRRPGSRGARRSPW